MTQPPLPARRLHEIARRKLSQLGIPSAVPKDDDALIGEIVSPHRALTNPLTKKPIERARFRVEGHDHARFLEPPILAALPPILFYDKASLQELTNEIAAKLDVRGRELKRFTDMLRGRQIPAEVDAELGIIRVRLELHSSLGTAIIEGDTTQMVAVELLSPDGPMKRPPVSLDRSRVDFAAFADRVELELHLSRLGEQAIAAGTRASTSPDKKGVLADTGDFELTLRTSDLQQAMTTGNLKPTEKTGVVADTGDFELMLATSDLEHAKVAAPPSTTPAAPTSVAAAFTAPAAPRTAPAPPRPPSTPPKRPTSSGSNRPLAGRVVERAEVRAVAPVLPPGSLTLRLLAEKIGPETLLGAGVVLAREFSIEGKRIRFEAKHKEGLTFVGRLLADDRPVWSEAFNLDGFPGVEEFARMLLGIEPEVSVDVVASPPGPQIGELWMMRVVVEREDGDEVRYDALDSDGQPYGAPRILPRAVFTQAFEAHAGGYRMRVKITGATAERVTYVRIAGVSTSVEQPRTVPAAAFVGQFVRDRAP